MLVQISKRKIRITNKFGEILAFFYREFDYSGNKQDLYVVKKKKEQDLWTFRV